MTNRHLIAPSVLSADFSKLGDEIEMLNRSEADWVHCDIMDGMFVPNLSFGIPVLQAIKKRARKPLDVHLMLVSPEKYISAFSKAGADILSVHYEACTHLDRTLYAIKEAGMKAGVAVNPSTPVDLLINILHCADLICVMSVNPGFGGQKFIENTYAKVSCLAGMIKKTNSDVKIEVDGGLNLHNSPLLLRAGADILVAGNTVFSSKNPSSIISELKNITVSQNV